MTKYQMLLGAAVINMVITLAYILVMGIRKQLVRGMMTGIHMILVPVAGPLLVFCSYLGFLILRCTKTAYINPEEISFRRKNMQIIEGDRLERGINKVPIEEALLAADSESLRRVLFDVLKTDYEGSIPLLQKAIESDDGEASHYASTAIADVLSKFKVRQKELDEQYHHQMDDGELLTAYRRYVYQHLSYHIFPQAEESRYTKLYDELMESAYMQTRQLDPQDYENWILLLLERGEKEKAMIWLTRMQEQYPDSLAFFRAELQFDYRYDHEKFRACLQKIRNSRIMLDADTLELVRFFQEA